jgi:glycosyltransferase involved in cell wall biosynthesis
MQMKSYPMISVITPSFNRVNFIKTAIESVLNQHYEAFEHIIVDGGSTDGTLELLTAYPHLRVECGPDQGLYDALNKGITMARGEIIGQLNSDDHYEPDVFTAIAELFDLNPQAEAISGRAQIFERHPGGEQTIFEYEGVSEDDLAYRATIGVAAFNAWFFRKIIYDRIGTYSLEYPTVADYDFLIRCHLKNIKVIPFQSVVYHYLQHSGSLTVKNGGNLWPSYLTEKFRLAEKYIHSKSSDQMIKKYLTEWNDLTAIELLISLVRQKQFNSAFDVVRTATRCNPYWPLVLMTQAPKRIRNYIRKKNAASR